MGWIEKFSGFFSSRIVSILKLDQDHEAVFHYGAFVILQTLWSMILIIIFGLVFKVLLEILVISITASLLRKYSGGVHATSSNRCAILGMLIFGALSLMAHMAIQSEISAISIFISCLILVLFAYFNVLKFAPVDNPNKPISKEHIRQKLKRQSLKVVYLFITTILTLSFIYFKFYQGIILYSILCISVGLAWQAFTLTSAGNMFVSKLDTILLNITKGLGGERYEE